MPHREPIIVISLGGSIMIPPTGFDPAFLRKFRDLILEQTKAGKRFIIICGGGATARAYQNAAREVATLTRDDLDWIGIHATRLNGHFLRTLFRGHAHPRVLKDPTRPFAWKEKEPIVIAAGWKPGASTDYDAVLMAKKFKAAVVVNLSNVKMLYDRDPRKHRDAEVIRSIGWKAFRKLVGSKWDPGANLPFDPVASKLAEKIGLRVILADGKNFANLEHILAGAPFVGSTIG